MTDHYAEAIRALEADRADVALVYAILAGAKAISRSIREHDSTDGRLSQRLADIERTLRS